MTGANIIACNFLLPLGIAIYVVAGGLRATFIVDFLHTVVLFVILYIFAFTIYGTSDVVGSPGKLYDLLQQAAVLAPVDGNADGSYTTMKSNGGILFGGCTVRRAPAPPARSLDRASLTRSLSPCRSPRVSPASSAIRATGASRAPSLRWGGSS